MDERSKIEQRERYERARRKHHRTREEQKAIEEAARARKVARREKKPQRRIEGETAAGEEDPEPGFEAIRRAPRLSRSGPSATRPESASARPGPGGSPPSTARLATAVVVVALHRGRVRVRDGGGREVDVSLVGGAERRGAGSLAVGDRALLRVPDGGGPASLERLPRRSVLSRPDPSDPRRERVLAANVDQALIVCSARRPALRPGLVERMLLALARGGVAPRICVNKLDLLEGLSERTLLLELCAPWIALGIPCHLLSAESGEGLAELHAALAGTTCVFVGHSGVGKSSLVNALLHAPGRAVGGVRRGEGKGRHTTSASQLVELVDGTRVIDTPGVRAFGLWEVDRETLDAAFPEIVTRAARCRFGDCTHAHEPDCAVLAAVLAGDLDGARLRSYQSLRAEV